MPISIMHGAPILPRGTSPPSSQEKIRAVPAAARTESARTPRAWARRNSPSRQEVAFLQASLGHRRRSVGSVIAPLLLLVLWMGVYPNSFLDPMAPSVDKLIGDYNAALKLARTAALP